jgi:ornithine carbamoyltransferase
VRVAWVGDGTNVLVSLAHLAPLLGMDVVAACPRATSRRRHAVELVRDPREAAAAPTCSSRTSGSRSARRRRGAAAARPRAVPPRRGARRARGPDAIVLHCLPAHPGEEITPECSTARARPSGTRREPPPRAKALLALLIG